jgi:transketolase
VQPRAHPGREGATNATDATDAAWLTESQRVAAGIRRRVLEHVVKHGEGYLSQACSAAELFAILYTRILRLAPVASPLCPKPFSGVPGPRNPGYVTGTAFNGERGGSLDRFIFSPTHYALTLYAALVEVGRMDEAGLDAYNVDGSTLETIGAEHSPGIEVTSGSFGQALSQAAGIAAARRMRGETGRVWVMMSDGEFEEGQTWEALAASAFQGLGNLRVVVDANGQQCDGPVSSVTLLEPLADRVRAFGASVDEVDGHDLRALEVALARPSREPHVVIARTDPARGMPLLSERAGFLHTVRIATADRPHYQAAYESMKR